MEVWIDIEACLPEFNTLVMTKTNKYGSIEEPEEIIKFRDNYGLWHDIDGKVSQYRPTYWRPL